MTEISWLPSGFVHPTRVALSDAVHLRPIRAEDVDIDMVAVMGNQPLLWQMYGEAWGWPPADMTREQDEADLARHAEEIERHESFNYAILPSDESALLGCVYIDPLDAVDERRRAEVSWWLVADAPHDVREGVGRFVPRWLAEEWPFDEVTYPFNSIR